jgi:hypothetical protein
MAVLQLRKVLVSPAWQVAASAARMTASLVVAPHSSLKASRSTAKTRLALVLQLMT